MCIIWAIVTIVLSFTGAPPRVAPAPVPAPVEGCVATVKHPCSYVATKPGGYEVVGTAWRVEIVRGDDHIVYAAGSPTNQSNVIRPGDRVNAWTGISFEAPATSVLRVGQQAGS